LLYLLTHLPPPHIYTLSLHDALPISLVLVIEDMHWADRSTRDLLAFLVRNQPSAGGVLIVATYRSDELHRTHPLRPLLAELDRRSEEHTSELQSRVDLVCRLLLDKKK